MAGRILVIRGGAIGDFLLTLPAIRLLRDGFPDAHIEILGYRHIVSIAEGRYYANAARSIEYGPLAGFFSDRSNLDPELKTFFAGFHQIVSYLFDPDEVFQRNLARCGVKDLIRGPAKIHDGLPAALQLAKPLERLALFLEDPAAVIFPNQADIEAAALLLHGPRRPRIAIHPGSGSPGKNWPPEKWIEFCGKLLECAGDRELVVLSGESDTDVLRLLKNRFGNHPALRFPGTHSLPVTGALLQSIGNMIGHDSGIGHLAAAAGCKCLLLFGPTDPEVWAPRNPGVRILRAPAGNLASLDVPQVLDAATSLFLS